MGMRTRRAIQEEMDRITALAVTFDEPVKSELIAASQALWWVVSNEAMSPAEFVLLGRSIGESNAA